MASRTGMVFFLRRISQELRPFWRECSLIQLAMLVELAFTFVFPLSLKFIIDSASKRSVESTVTVQPLFLPIGLIAIAAIAAIASSFGQEYLYARLNANLVNSIRLKLFKRLQQLSMNFYSKSKVGDLMDRFSSDLITLENTVVAALPAIALQSMSILVGLVVMSILDWRLTLLAIVVVPSCAIGPRLISRRANLANVKFKERLGDVSSFVQENLSAQSVVKAFTLERFFEEDFERKTSILVRLSKRANFWGYMMYWTADKTVLLQTVLVVAVGSVAAYYGVISVGGLVAFYLVFSSLNLAVSGLTSALPWLVRGSASMKRIDEIFDSEPHVKDADDADSLDRPCSAIEFEATTFGYEPNQVTIDDVSFRIPFGSIVAFVGASGSGKSTILNLILRFYDPRSGKVKIDGSDLRSVTMESLRSHVGTVFQDSFLFNTTIRENIRLGYPEATDAEVEEAAKLAEIHDLIIGLPMGYDTPVGERGSRLSGGQRQRVAIARALVRDPAILVLDEATSALDPCIEHELNQTIKNLTKNRTVVSVTHRLGPVVDFDCIYVMQDGRLVEEGPHFELLQNGDVYGRLWGKQSGFSISSDGSNAQVEPSRLRSIPLLWDLDDNLLEELATQFVMEHFVAGRTIIYEGDAGDKFYILIRGRVSVSRRNLQGDEEEIAVLQDGDHFGEIALLRDTSRTATVTTQTDCILLSLQRGRFASLLERSESTREFLEEVYEERSQGGALTDTVEWPSVP